MNILVDHGSSNNLGDASMLLSVVANLSERFPDARLHVVGRKGFSYGSGWGAGVELVPAYELFIPFIVRNASLASRARRRVEVALRRRVLIQSDAREKVGFGFLQRGGRAADLALRTPGGLSLGDYCEPYDGLHVVGGGNLTDSFPWQLIHRACLIRAFQEQGKPVVLTGQQVGPFATDRYWPLVADALRRASFVGVREPTESVNLVHRAGVPAERTAMMGDDAFGLPLGGNSEIDARLRARGIEPGRFFAVNVRMSEAYAAEHAAHLGTVASMVDRLAEAYGVPALVVPVALNESDSDLASGERLRERVETAEIHLLDDVDLSPYLAKAAVKRALGVVGVSYHFCTFALSQGVPAVCIYNGSYYGQKAQGLATLWGDPRIALPLNETDGVSASTHVREVWDDEALRAHLSGEAQRVTARWHEVFAQATSPFESISALAPAAL